MINADAMQTYDAFPILTAQPSAEERARAPHTLYGVLPLSETVSAARWRTLASAEIERALAEGRVPILCGGSGLYLRTLMQGISAIPDAPPELREQANAEWAALGADAFRERLASHDPAIVARLKPATASATSAPGRSGRPPAGRSSQWQEGEASAAPWRFATVLLSPDRAWLRDRIERRFDVMLAQGVEAEVRAVFDRQPRSGLAGPEGAWRS